MNFISSSLLNTHNGSSFSIGIQDGIYYFRDHTYFEQPLLNTEEYVDFCGEVRNLSYDSILIGGLGLGVVPQYIALNTSCSIIDVVEVNNELIEWTNSNNHLDSNINIIEGDILTYTPSRTYDLVLVDIWWDGADPYPTQEQTIKNIYSNKLNPGGSLYFPLAPVSLYSSGSF